MTRRLDHPLIAKLALLWLSAERAAKVAVGQMIANDAAEERGDTDNPKLLAQEELVRAESVKIGNERTDDDMAIAVDRVAMVLAGEVRWSEAGPGDKAVWKSRFRDVEKFTQWWRHEREMKGPNPRSESEAHERKDDDEFGVPLPPWPDQPPVGRRGPRLHGYRERLWSNFYDTLRINRDARNGTRMFGNANIGNQFLTNLVIPGQLGYGESSFVMLAFYAAISNLDALSFFADNLTLSFVVGQKPMIGPLFGRDAFMGIPLSPPLARPIIIPVRQYITVQVDWRTHKDGLTVMPPDLDFDLIVHIEGLLTRDVQ